jgi:hypothetical protein
MGRGMELDIAGSQLCDGPPAVVGVTHVVAGLHLAPFVGEQVMDADRVRHLGVKMEAVGMDHSQRPYLHLRTGFLSDFPQDASEHGFGGLQTAADDLPSPGRFRVGEDSRRMRLSSLMMIACTATAELAKRRPWASVMNGCGVDILVLGGRSPVPSPDFLHPRPLPGGELTGGGIPFFSLAPRGGEGLGEGVRGGPF